MKPFISCAVLLLLSVTGLQAQEVLEPTHTEVAVRNHPRTGKPFVSITPEGLKERDPFAPLAKNSKRPDYRMLDPKVKPRDVGYDGPVSDRKKVYILAASLATVGTVGGTAIIAAAPAATGAGAAGGAGVFAGAGAGVAAGTISGTLAARRRDPERINFTHVSESRAVNTQNSNMESKN